MSRRLFVLLVLSTAVAGIWASAPAAQDTILPSVENGNLRLLLQEQPAPDPEPPPPPPPPEPTPDQPPPKTGGGGGGGSSPPPSPPPSSSPAPAPPSSSPSPPATSPAPAVAAPKPKAKPAKKKKKAKRAKPKPEPVVTFYHPPRDPAVTVSTPFTGGGETVAVAPAPAVAATADERSSAVERLGTLIAVGALALALILLIVASIPDWIVGSARAALLLQHWRVQIAASGVSALLLAAVVFLIGVSGI